MRVSCMCSGVPCMAEGVGVRYGCTSAAALTFLNADACLRIITIHPTSHHTSTLANMKLKRAKVCDRNRSAYLLC